MDSRLKILETLYRFDLGVTEHGQLIQRAAEQYWHKRDPVAFVSGTLTSEGDITLTLETTRDDAVACERSLHETMRASSATDRSAWISASPIYGSAMEAVHQGKLSSRLAASWIDHTQIVDMLGFYGGTHEAGLVALVAFLDARPTVSHRTRAHWQPLAAHLAAAWRIRQRFGASAASADLIDVALHPDGRVRDARVAVTTALRNALGAAVRQRERERVSRTAAGHLWPELIAGRWTLIDHFESEGRRSVVALRNTPLGERLCRLTAHEAAALDMASKGAANKEIALSMQLTPSSVTRLLQSATRKLNATLANLIQLLATGMTQHQDLAFGSTNLSVLSPVVASTAASWQELLSEAESSVVSAVLRGYSNHEIATLRGSSVRTVINQLASAFEKLAIQSRRELLRWPGASGRGLLK